MPWHPLEHDVWKTLKRYGLEDRNEFLLAVSGGLDSMVLLEVFLNIKPKASFIVATYNHGISTDARLNDYRIRAVECVRARCRNEESVEFITETSNLDLKSENDFRSARWQFIHQIKRNGQLILTAHHLDDWVETLTLKMIRGVGVEGFTAFQIWDDQIFRPFLETKKVVLEEYAKSKNLTWIEDPSNHEDHYLRNWLREKWFKTLDEKNPSGYENYSRSLLRITQALAAKEEFQIQHYLNNSQSGMDRQWYTSLSKEDQLRAISVYMRHKGVLDSSRGKLAEIQKRLDKNQKELTFTIGKINWVINEKQIMLGF